MHESLPSLDELLQKITDRRWVRPASQGRLAAGVSDRRRRPSIRPSSDHPGRYPAVPGRDHHGSGPRSVRARRRGRFCDWAIGLRPLSRQRLQSARVGHAGDSDGGNGLGGFRGARNPGRRRASRRRTSRAAADYRPFGIGAYHNGRRGHRTRERKPEVLVDHDRGSDREPLPGQPGTDLPARGWSRHGVVRFGSAGCDAERHRCDLRRRTPGSGDAGGRPASRGDRVIW